jgi:hypothetical protein
MIHLSNRFVTKITTDKSNESIFRVINAHLWKRLIQMDSSFKNHLLHE